MDEDKKSLRKSPRVSWGFLVRFRSRGGDDPWGAGTIKNISEGGCYFGTGQKTDPGVVLEIQVKLPTLKDPMLFVGEVTRCDVGDGQNVFLVGVKFLEMDVQKKEDFIRTLTFFLKKQSKGQV